jgi:hypothetical protein
MYLTAAKRTDGLAPAVMAWLMRHGYPMDANIYQTARVRGLDDAAQWLADHGCPTA